ncbi:MAG: hypothetical protein ACOYL6_03000 [Bacteriovoracaceae bacterium]
METQMKSMVLGPKGPRGINLFAYSTNGLPGLEIHIGTLSTKTMREKFIFLSKTRKLPIPLKRYVLCAELEGIKVTEDQAMYLELPLLMLYWHLAGLIPLMNLSDCFTQGTISSTGQLQHSYFPLVMYQGLEREFMQMGQKNFTLILDGDTFVSSEIQCLPTLEVLSNIPYLTLHLKSGTMKMPTSEAPQIGFS